MSRTDGPDLLLEAEALAAEAEGEDAFVVDTEGFEGPLHLLLALARRQKVDLLHIPIVRLADQYLAYVADAQRRRIDLAADYLLMASWLALLKSRLLLPSPPKARPDDEDADLAAQLAVRLGRLEALRRASDALWAGNLLARDVFMRGAPEHPVVVKRATYDASLCDVMAAFADIQLRRVKVSAHRVRRQPVLTLETARRRLAEIVRECDEWRSVQELQAEPGDAPDAPRRSVTASFFSAALEMAREGAVDLRQDAPLSDVYLRRAGATRATRKRA